MSNWDQSQFDAALKAHLANTSRTIERVINGRAYFVALAAIRLTVKVSAAKIEAELGRIVRVEKISKKGRKYNRKQLQLTPGRDGRAPLAALIINKRLGRGETFHGLSGRGAYGREMRDAIKYLIGVRKRSVAFIASGWIPALRILYRPREMSRGMIDPAVKQVGPTKKGHAIRAQAGGALIVATIINSAISLHETNNALGYWGARGLQLAFDHETAEIIRHLQNKLKPDFAAANRTLAGVGP